MCASVHFAMLPNSSKKSPVLSQHLLPAVHSYNPRPTSLLALTGALLLSAGRAAACTPAALVPLQLAGLLPSLSAESSDSQAVLVV